MYFSLDRGTTYYTFQKKEKKVRTPKRNYHEPDLLNK
jgi:hypothetical protein